MCKINIWYFSMWIRKKAFPGEIVSNIPRGNINAKCPCLSGTIPDCFAFEGIIRTNVQNDICRNMEIYIYIFSFGHNSDSWSNNFWRMKENFAKSFETCFNDKLVLVTTLKSSIRSSCHLTCRAPNGYRFYPFHLSPRTIYLIWERVLWIRVYPWPLTNITTAT